MKLVKNECWCSCRSQGTLTLIQFHRDLRELEELKALEELKSYKIIRLYDNYILNV
jgi:hypothetical protein